MNPKVLFDSLELLDLFIDQAHRRQQTGALVEPALLADAEDIRHRLVMLATTQGLPPNSPLQLIDLAADVLLQLPDGSALS